MTTVDRPDLEGLGRYAFGWADPDVAGASAKRGLSEAVVREISALKNEPEWMLDFRLKGLRLFDKKPMPGWGADLSGIDFDNIKYFVRSSEKQAASWDELPADIKNTYDKLGIPEAEKQRLIAGVAAQYESEVVYHSIREDLEEKGVLFLDTDTGLREHNDLFKEYFGSAIPAGDNKFSALNTAVWSGGSFIYVPPGVHVDIPLQAYFRINTENMGQFERTLIIADEDSYVHYVEGCLPAGELITTADGDLRPIESIRVGDHVLGHDGRPHRVTAVQARDLNGSLVEFSTCSDANSFRVTEEHPVLVVRRDAVDDDAQFVPAMDVREGDRLVFPKQRLAAPSTVLPIDFARLAGLYVSDRVSVEADNGLVFTFAVDDADLADDLRRAVKNLYDAETLVRENVPGRTLSVVLAHPGALAALVQHAGNPLASSVLSADLMAQDEVFIRELIRCCSGGGCDAMSRRSGRSLELLTASEALALQLQALLARLGSFAVVEEASGQFRVSWSEGQTPAGVLERDDHYLVSVEKLTVLEAHEFVYNLDVEEPDSYLAGGFAVHNCTAPIYSSDSLHSAVVEIIVKKNARVRYTTIQNWSNNVYNLVTKRAIAHEGATMEWIDGNLGCLAEGSTVTTPAGVKPIEELTPGEQVLAYDDTTGELCFRTVLGKKFSGHQAVREVRVGERQLRVTDNHPFYSWTYDESRAKKSGRYQLAYVRADQLKQAIVPATSLDYGEPHKLELPELTTSFTSNNQWGTEFEAVRSRASRLTSVVETNDDLMWLFGAFVGDGSISTATGVNGGKRWSKVTFSVPATDRARDQLVAVMEWLAPEIAPTERADGVAITWNSVELAEFFERNGFVTGAHVKRVPDWVLSLPESQRLSFLAGYLDTDGCASAGRRGLSIKSVNRELLDDVAKIVVSLGMTPRLYTESDTEEERIVVGRKAVSRGSHRLDFAADARLLWYLSPGLQAAADRQVPAELIHHRTIGRSNIQLPESVEVRDAVVGDPLDVVPTWDIEVEGTGNFVSQGFIVHNSKITMKYPAVWMVGEHAKGETLSIAFAGEGQHQDAGAKMVHAAPHTSSTIISKSVARGGGRTSYRGLVQVQPGSHHSKSTVKCDALLVDTISRSDTYPYVDVREDDVQMGHEATVSKVSEDQLFYLMSRGLSEDVALAMIVRGFVEPIARELPMEYALELNRLIELQMEGSVG